MRKPLDSYKKITTHFGDKTFKQTFHDGTDYSANKGTPIYSVAPGWVMFSDTLNDKDGLGVKIEHDLGWTRITCRYWHCSKVLVKKNQKVKEGQVIGKVGSTGYSTGSHLHFDIHADGRYQDPELFMENVRLRESSENYKKLHDLCLGSLKKAEKEREAISRTLTNTQRELERLKKDHDQRVKQMERLNKTIIALNESVSAKDAKIVELEVEGSGDNKEIEQWKMKYLRVEPKVKELQTEIKEIGKVIKKKDAEHSKAVSKLRVKLSNATSDLTACQGRVLNLEDDLVSWIEIFGMISRKLRGVK